MDIHSIPTYSVSTRAQLTQTDLAPQASTEAEKSTTDTSDSNIQERNIDFRNMSRDDLKTWINEELKAGNMTFDESMPFMLMTLNLDAETLASVNGSEPVNFMDMAKNVAEFHRSIGNKESAEGLERALEIMQKEQRGPLSVIA